MGWRKELGLWRGRLELDLKDKGVEEDVALGWYPGLASHGQQRAPKAWLPGHLGVWDGLDCLCFPGPVWITDPLRVPNLL